MKKTSESEVLKHPFQKKSIVDGRVVVETVNDEPSLTQQQFKDECDVNNILKRYQTTGEISHLAKTRGVYADFSSVEDYHTSLNKINNAEEAFFQLPAEIRDRFANDPAKLLEFVKNEKNYDEGVKLGLFEEKAQSPSPSTPQKQNLKQKPNAPEDGDSANQLPLETKEKKETST